ncbi:protein RoBo-1 [Esox lucius]|uniref:protein RoBo-1 n=1 Tax=Esox lucius TaxID=8010 RepID=UPI001476A78F|nr:protein RoBo-1 [Esox lucius]
MNLILNISFTFLLLYTVESLQCYTCMSEECNETMLQTCSSGDICSTSTKQLGPLGTRVSKECSSIEESCVSLATTTILSVSSGYSHASNTAYCCRTDGCNLKTLSVLSDKPNTLQCYTCNSKEDRVCDTTLKCIGVEDHCFNFTEPTHDGSNDEENVPSLGCASADFCSLFETHYLPNNFQCCKGNLCNKALGMSLKSPLVLLGVLVISLA